MVRGVGRWSCVGHVPGGTSWTSPYRRSDRLARARLEVEVVNVPGFELQSGQSCDHCRVVDTVLQGRDAKCEATSIGEVGELRSQRGVGQDASASAQRPDFSFVQRAGDPAHEGCDGAPLKAGGEVGPNRL